MLHLLLPVLAMLTVSDTTNTRESAVELDPIVVVGQREPVRLSRSVNSAIRLTPSSIESAQEVNVLSLLRNDNASVEVSSVNAVGFGLGTRGQGKLLIRGLGFAPNRGSLVLIDGRPDIAGLFGHPLPDTYVRSSVRSAELVKGGASTLYGSNAVAGVLDLQSFYRPDYDRYTNVELRTGSYNTLNGMIQHSRKAGSAIVSGWYEYIESDNHRANNEYFNRSAGFRVQLNEIGGFNTFVTGRYSGFEFADPGPVYSPARLSGDIWRSGVTFGLDRAVESYSVSARVYNSYGEHEFSDGFGSVDRNTGLDVFGKVKGVGYEGLALSGGFSINNLGGSGNSPASLPNGASVIKSSNFSENEYAAHMQAELELGSTVSLTAGGRYVEHERYNGHFVYQSGLVFSPESYGSFKVSVGSAYRNPTISELFLLPPGNPELEPEEGTFYEFGYFRQIGEQLSVEGAVFHREGDNLILTVANPSPPPMQLNRNTGEYQHWGYEATLRFILSKWTFAPSYTHLEQEDYNLSVPSDKLVLSGTYNGERLSAHFAGIAAFNTASDSLGTPVTLDDYFIVNLDNSYRLTQFVELSLRVENLFDEQYQTVHGYPMPGITFRGGVAVKMY